MSTQNDLELTLRQIKESLATESGKLVPINADSRMLDAAVAFALNVQIGGEYTWSHYMADLYRRFLEFAPTVKDSLTVEQGGDELVKAIEGAIYKLKSDSPSIIRNANALDILTTALANRRGGE